MKKTFCSTLLGFALLGSNTSQAAVIDFNSDKSFHNSPETTYQEDGFQLTAHSPYYGAFLFWGNTDPKWSQYNADPGGNTLTDVYTTRTTLTRVDKGVFDFHSIDMTDTYNRGMDPYNPGLEIPSKVGFDFLFNDASIISTEVTLDKLVGLQTFTFNYYGLLAVTWTPSWHAQVDNIIVNSSAELIPNPAAVALIPNPPTGIPVPVVTTPIPAAVWLFGSSLVGLMGFNRKRSQSLAVL